ncbi:peptidase S41 [Bacteroidia bacterium]|nr:peptidase S41 [Bacteroidia bacterium]
MEIDKYDNTARGNFEALWKIMDEHYCFFEYKQVDWDKIHAEYSQGIDTITKVESLFNVLDKMLQELKDGHVNITSSFNVGRYWKWFEDYPANYKQELINAYLGTDYQIAGGMRYKILDDNVGYMRYADFSSSIGETGLDYVLLKFRDCAGMIIDVRDNGGGMLSNSDRLASRFFEEKTLVGYIQHKTGKGHNDFSELTPQYITPSLRVQYLKPVVVLTNRKCYSATNDFVSAMTYAPHVTIVGDKTGGGSGLPFYSEIPIGWPVRFSACPMYNAEKQQIEFGIEPDIPVGLSNEDAQKEKDTIIEAARKLIIQH